jgi:hypothetical protein
MGKVRLNCVKYLSDAPQLTDDAFLQKGKMHFFIEFIEQKGQDC